MSRQIAPLGIVVLITIGFAFGVLTMVISNMQRGESPHKSYERGYKDASWFVKYDIEANPTVVTDNLGRTWYRIDSIDTIPPIDEYSYIATFLVYDSVNKKAVMGARVLVTQAGYLSPILARGITDASGHVGFGLYNDDYSAVADVHPFHSFPPLDFTIESGSYLDTIFFAQIIPDSTDTMPAVDGDSILPITPVVPRSYYHRLRPEPDQKR